MSSDSSFLRSAPDRALVVTPHSPCREIVVRPGCSYPERTAEFGARDDLHAVANAARMRPAGNVAAPMLTHLAAALVVIGLEKCHVVLTVWIYSVAPSAERWLFVPYAAVKINIINGISR
jgi:hypothetical protein